MLSHLNNVISSDTCKWSTNDVDLDLSILSESSIPIDCYSSSGNWIMFYTPCKNELGCDAVSNATYLNNTRYMITHMSLNTGNCHLYLASWEGNDAYMPYKHHDKDTGKQMYTFNYTNGYKDPSGSGDGCENGRYINITYICDTETNKDIPYNPENINCLKYPYTEDNICYYTINIPSYLACADASNNNNNNDSLGAGWIIFIILLIGFMLYCVIGYMINAIKNNNNFFDFKNNIPNHELCQNICCFCCNKRSQPILVNDNDSFGE